eukprot:943634-Rhodomonas_salina.4
MLKASSRSERRPFSRGCQTHTHTPHHSDRSHNNAHTPPPPQPYHQHHHHFHHHHHHHHPGTRHHQHHRTLSRAWSASWRPRCPRNTRWISAAASSALNFPSNTRRRNPRCRHCKLSPRAEPQDRLDSHACRLVRSSTALGHRMTIQRGQSGRSLGSETGSVRGKRGEEDDGG